MVIINDFNVEDYLRSVPMELIEMTEAYINTLDGKKDTIEFVILFGENKGIVEKSANELGLIFENLGFGFGIISVSTDKFKQIAKLKGVQYIELPAFFKTNDVQSNTVSCVQQAWNNYNLRGKGVLIGFIDTGIDYKHPVFRDLYGKTRIKCIYNLFNGAIYDENQINSALESDNPNSIVPENDFLGHGTATASVAAGGGLNTDNYGVAPEASIIMVKITDDQGTKLTIGTQILRGLKFLMDKSTELNMPIVINISLSSNQGAHNGSTLVEKYLYEYSQIQRVALVVAAGNEGATGHHYSSEIDISKDIFINVGSGEKLIVIQLYKEILMDISVQLITPSGEKSKIIKIEEGIKRIELKKHKLVFYYSGPKPFSKNGEISIGIRGKDGSIEEGQWILKINNINLYTGLIDIWLPIAAALNPETKFLEPDPFNTLGIPATVETVISVGSYNASADNYSYFSGRGIKRVGKVMKPDLLAPGENINVAMPGGFFGPETGTSVAAPQVSGACALMLEWGIVKNNDPYLFGEKIKYYLLKGARRTRKGTIHPDQTFGYGYLCIGESLTLLRQEEVAFEGSNEIRNEKFKGCDSLVRKKRIEKNKNLQKSKNPIINEDTKNGMKNNINVLSDLKCDISKECLEQFKKDEYVGKTQIKGTTNQYYLTEGFIDFLVQYDGDIINAIEAKKDIASAFTIDESYAIVSVKADKVGDVINIREVIYIDSGGVYTLSSISPSDASNTKEFNYNPYLNLTGRDTLIGIIDTGIDFLNKNFRNADNTTNIIRIWDQSLKYNGYGFNMPIGVEYKDKDINDLVTQNLPEEEIRKKIETIDDNGHGTAIASLIAGRGNFGTDRGIAPDAKIAMVKLKKADKAFREFYASDKFGEYQYRNTDILIGIRYLFGVARELNKPMVIYIPLGTTVGGHDGSSVIERYIDDLSDSNGILFVTSTGNEGISDNHTSGIIEKVGDTKDIELEVGENQTEIFMTIYSKAPDKMGISVMSPSGDIFKNINPKQKDGINLNFVYEGTQMKILFIEPSELTGDQVIVIQAKNLKPGIWVFTLIGEYIVNQTFNAWLLQRELLDTNTKFLTPTTTTTMTIPATSYNILSVGSYNQNNNSVLSTSGRGKTRDGRQCPILAAGGDNAKVSYPGDSMGVMSGGSIAGAVVSGACCQLLQWGVVEGNDRTMYPVKIQTYFMRGTNQRVGDSYPNNQIGYGTFDMKVLFNNLKGSAIGSPKDFSDAEFHRFNVEQKSDNNEFYEFEHRGIYFRVPKD